MLHVLLSALWRGLVGTVVGAFFGALLLVTGMATFSAAVIDIGMGRDPNAWIPGALIIGGCIGAVFGAVANVWQGKS